MGSYSSRRSYPKWFIDELVNEEDKIKARNGSLTSKYKVKFRCAECRNLYEQVVWYHIKLSTGERKQGCPICGKEKKIENRIRTVSAKRSYPKWFIDELVNEEDKIKARDGSLMNTSKVKLRCERGHVYEQVVGNHIKISTCERKRGCPICGKLNRKNNKIKTISSKRVYPEWFINELISDEDKERSRNGLLMNHSKVKFRCTECENIYEQLVYNHIKVSTKERKQGCPICGKEKKTENRMKTISSKRVYPKWFIDELVNEEDKAKARNGTLMNTSKVKFKCDKGHIYEQVVGKRIKFSTCERTRGCPICKHLRSKPELEIEDYVKSLEYTTQHKRIRDSNSKTFEIDVFIPEINVGVEYNGSYYHSVENDRIDSDYHYNKFNECRKKNILLITIFDVEWDRRKDDIKQYIKDIIIGKDNDLSYEKEGYMNNNYPSWKHYKDNGKYFEYSYLYRESYKVYTCGYTKIEEN